jgi:hypothetical protein
MHTIVLLGSFLRRTITQTHVLSLLTSFDAIQGPFKVLAPATLL